MIDREKRTIICVFWTNITILKCEYFVWFVFLVHLVVGAFCGAQKLASAITTLKAVLGSLFAQNSAEFNSNNLRRFFDAHNCTFFSHKKPPFGQKKKLNAWILLALKPKYQLNLSDAVLETDIVLSCCRMNFRDLLSNC